MQSSIAGFERGGSQSDAAMRFRATQELLRGETLRNPADCLVRVGRGEPSQTAARAGRRRFLRASRADRHPRISETPSRISALADVSPCPGRLILRAGQDVPRFRCGLS